MAQAPDPKIARLMQLQDYLDGKSSRGERQIIEGGAPRSGTTMFQSMMNSHPQILLGGADPWVGGRGKFTNPEPENLDKWRKGLTANEIEILNSHFRDYPIFAALGYTFE